MVDGSDIVLRHEEQPGTESAEPPSVGKLFS